MVPACITSSGPVAASEEASVRQWRTSRAASSPVSSRHPAAPGSIPFSCASTSLNCSRVIRYSLNAVGSVGERLVTSTNATPPPAHVGELCAKNSLYGTSIHSEDATGGVGSLDPGMSRTMPPILPPRR